MQTTRRSLMLGCDLNSLEILRDGQVFSLGPYFPRHGFAHWDSSWSQIVLRAKKNDAWIIMVLGQILAAHLEHCLLKPKKYVMTYVPGKSCVTQRLAYEICSNLSDECRVCSETLLAQIKRKKKGQHYCRTLSERRSNVRECYQVIKPERVKGQNILVLDDIVTSRATFVECCRLLRRAGADFVTGMALARTVKV